MTDPIVALLTNEQLTGENYAKWKSNMNIILVCNDFKFVITEECPPEPDANASKADKDAYNRWIHANNKAKCYLLVGMSDVIRTKHADMGTAYEILQSLDGMFGQPSQKALQDVVRAVMNNKMKPGTSVRAHVLEMISHLHEAEINGAVIDEATQVGMIMETLPPSFQQFKNNYVMNKLSLNLHQLLNELQSFESVNVKTKEGEANVVECGSSSKKRRKGWNKKAKSNDKKGKKVESEKGNDSKKKAKGNCFHCDQPGHWKRNCKKYLEELKKKKDD